MPASASTARDDGMVHVSWLTSSHSWMLVHDYETTLKDGQVTIKSGFCFDLASVPRPFWPLIAPHELSIAAPLVHDYLYRKGTKIGDQVATRKQADAAFLELMTREGVRTWKATLAYAAVKLTGWVFFHRDEADPD